MHVPIDKYVFSIDLAQRNRKKTLLNTRFAFSVNLRLASLICRADPRRIKSKTREKSRQTQNRRTIEPRRCQKAIVRFGLNLKKKTTIKPYENFKLGSPTKPLEKHWPISAVTYPRASWPTVVLKTLFYMYNKALFAWACTCT